VIAAAAIIAALEVPVIGELLDADLEEIETDDALVAAIKPATQVIVHKLPGDQSARPRGGVYRVSEKGGIEFLRPGAGLLDRENADELLLVTRRTGEPVTPRKEFARVFSRSAEGEHSPGLEQLVSYLRSGIG